MTAANIIAIPADLSHRDDHQVAIANAGHAIYALSLGLRVGEVSTATYPSISLASLPPLMQAGEYPTTIPLDDVLRLLLAGEAALEATTGFAMQWHDPRPIAPPLELASQLISAKAPGDRPHQLDRRLEQLRDDLYYFFLEDHENLRHLEWIAHLLISEVVLSGERLHSELFSGRCGALCKWGHRCTLQAFHGGHHRSSVVGVNSSIEWPSTSPTSTILGTN